MVKIPGPNKLRTKPNFAQEVKAMAKAAGKDIFPKIKISKIRRPYKPRPNARKPHKTDEKHIQKHIIWYLRTKGALCGKVKVAATLYRGRYIKDDLLFLGVPDLMAFYDGRFWFIEVKTKTGRLSSDQIIFRDECLKAGINHLVARSIEDVREVVE